ncbi:MAG: hypothetical protein ACP5F3_03330 [Candidatus Syntrophosphaera sp.]
MINEKIESFLEKTDMNYLFCLLAKLEANRLSQLPVYVRQRFQEKLAVISMNHVAENEVPDYFAEIEEANRAMAELESPFSDEEPELGEETVDDSRQHIEELAEEEGEPEKDEVEERMDLGNEDKE